LGAFLLIFFLVNVTSERKGKGKKKLKALIIRQLTFRGLKLEELYTPKSHETAPAFI